MSDAGPSVQEPAEPTPATQPAAVAKKPGMFADPVVRNMALAATLLVIMFLVLVLGVLITGVASRTGPRSLSENQLAVARAAVRGGKADPATWGRYIAVLIDAGRYSQAQGAIKDAKASSNDSATTEFAVAEVRLLNAREDYKKAITVAGNAQKRVNDLYQALLDGGGQKAMTAKHDGLDENWFVLALLKADAYKSLGDWDKVIKELDTYLAAYPRAADILVDRGRAKIEVKDTAGAEKDFREALRFVPDSEEALKGLEKIGATDR